MTSAFCDLWIIRVIDRKEDVSRVCEIRKSFLRVYCEMRNDTGWASKPLWSLGLGSASAS